MSYADNVVILARYLLDDRLAVVFTAVVHKNNLVIGAQSHEGVSEALVHYGYGRTLIVAGDDGGYAVLGDGPLTVCQPIIELLPAFKAAYGVQPVESIFQPL